MKNKKKLIHFGSSEKYAWLCGSFGVLLILVLSTLVTLDGFVSHDKYTVVILLLGVAPLVSCLFLSRPPRCLAWLMRPGVSNGFLFLNLILIAVGATWLGASTFGLHLPPFNAKILSAGCLLVLIAFGVSLYLSRNAATFHFDWKWLSAGNIVLIFVVPVVLIAAVILPPDWYLIRPFNKTAATWGSIVALATVVMWHMSFHEKWGKPLIWGMSALVFLAPFFMIDVELSYDALHYTAYLGPAAAVAAGRVPLIDVFSQYGQSYLIYDLGFLFLPKTYHAAALVTTICNAVYMLCVLIILRKLIRNHAVFLVLGVSLPFLFWMAYHYAPTNTPSHGALRYLPIYLVGTSLILMHREKLFTIFSIAALCLAWAWSFEAAVYSTFIYLTFLIVRACAMSMTSLKGRAVLVARHVSFLFILFIVFAIFVSVGYWFAFGKLPRYDLYLNLVLSYVGTDPFMDYTFFQTGFFAWVPILASYFVVICMIVRKCFQRQNEAEWSSSAAVLVAMGLAVGVYCLISTQTFILKAVILPFYLLFYWALDRAVSCRPRDSLITVSEIGLAPVFIFLFAVLSGVAVSNFFGEPVYATPNTSMLRHLLSFGRALPENFEDRLSSFCSTPGTIEPGNACSANNNMPDPHFNELKHLLDRWQKSDPTLLTFHPDDAILDVYYQKPQLFPLSFSYVDGFSPRLFKYIVDRSQKIIAEDIHEGQTVIVAKDLATLNELQWALIYAIAHQWTLEKIDETEHLAAYRLVKDAHIVGSSVLALPNRPVKKRNSL